MFSLRLRPALVSIIVTAGLLAAAAPASASAGTNLQPRDALLKTPIDDMDLSIRGDADNGHAGFCGVDVSADHIEAYVVTNNNDPDAMAIARGTRDIASAGYQHNQTDLAHG